MDGSEWRLATRTAARALPMLMVLTSTPAAAQVERIGLDASRWTFDQGTASQPPTIQHGISLSLGLDQVRRLSPQFRVSLVPEGQIDPGLVGATAELRVLLVGAEDGVASVLTLGGGLAAVLAGNRAAVVDACSAPCMFEWVGYETTVGFMSTAGLGVLLPIRPRLSLAPSVSYAVLSDERHRVMRRLGVGLVWRR
jgi:hypothetical protein